TTHVATCGPTGSNTIPAGHNVKVVLNGATNPTTPSTTLTLTVGTTSDPSPVTSPNYTAQTAHQVSNVAVDNTAPSNAAGARTSYAISFTASSTGGLASVVNSQITISFPAGTDLSTVVSTQLYDTTVSSSNSIGFCGNLNNTTHVATCGPTGSNTIPAGHNVKVVLNGATNPTTPSTTLTLTVGTTSDPSPVTSPNYTGQTAQQVSNVAVDNTAPSNAAGARTGYAISFTASSTGGLASVANSQITISFPAGTD